MAIKSDNPAHVGMHAFERAGLGKAPFRCVGVSEMTYQACPGAPVQPGGSCDYCGTGIVTAYWVRSRDGKEFKVGCNCISKTGDRGLIQSYKNLPEVRKAQREARQRLDDKKKAEWNTLINAPETVEKLSGMFVERKIFGREWGQFEIQRVPYIEDLKSVWAMCGAAGRARYLKQLKKILAEEPR